MQGQGGSLSGAFATEPGCQGGFTNLVTAYLEFFGLMERPAATYVSGGAGNLDDQWSGGGDALVPPCSFYQRDKGWHQPRMFLGTVLSMINGPLHKNPQKKFF